VSLAGVAQRLGHPPEQCWQYTWSPSRRSYRARAICVSRGKVFIVIRGWER